MYSTFMYFYNCAAHIRPPGILYLITYIKLLCHLYVVVVCIRRLDIPNLPLLRLTVQNLHHVFSDILYV